MNGEPFLFKDDAGRPYKVLWQRGKPWLYRWQLEQVKPKGRDLLGYWVAVREIHDKDLPAYQVRRLAEAQEKEYESAQDEYLKFKTVK